MNNTAAIHHGIVQAIRWLAPAWCLLCRRQHNTACAICADCEAASSRNRHACHRCALPLETTHSSEVNRLAFAQLSAQTLCPTCIRHSPAVVSARALPDANRHTGPDSPVEISESPPTVLARRRPPSQRLTPSRQRPWSTRQHCQPARAGANPDPMESPGESRI